MENSEQPINPIIEDNNYNGNIVREARYLGLTKREYFTGLAMQGLITKDGYFGGHTDIKNSAIECIMIAYGILKQLNEQIT